MVNGKKIKKNKRNGNDHGNANHQLSSSLKKKQKSDSENQ